MKANRANYYSLFLAAALLVISVEVAPLSAAGLRPSCRGGEACPPSGTVSPRYRGKRPRTSYKIGFFGGSSDSIGDVPGGRRIIEESLKRWGDVASSNLRLRASRKALRLNSVKDVINRFQPRRRQGSVAIIDNSGEGINGIFGSGSSDSILGLGGPTFINSKGTKILESRLLINGALFQQGQLFGASQAQLKRSAESTIVHEIGHSFGLDHSQLFDGNFTSGESGEQAANEPVMFPTAFDLNRQNAELKADDIASISNAYKASSFANNYATITGNLRNNNNAVTGFVVVAYDINDPLRKAVSSPSDFRGQSNGAFNIAFPVRDSSEIGLRFTAIGRSFTGASSIGPYSPNTNTRISSGFYNGPNNPLIDNSTDTQSAVSQIGDSGIFVINAGERTRVGTIDLADLN